MDLARGEISKITSMKISNDEKIKLLRNLSESLRKLTSYKDEDRDNDRRYKDVTTDEGSFTPAEQEKLQSELSRIKFEIESLNIQCDIERSRVKERSFASDSVIEDFSTAKQDVAAQLQKIKQQRAPDWTHQVGQMREVEESSANKPALSEAERGRLLAQLKQAATNMRK